MKDNRFVLFILVVALLYIISPVDFVPDVVPVAGWIDDAAVGLGAGATCVEAMG